MKKLVLLLICLWCSKNIFAQTSIQRNIHPKKINTEKWSDFKIRVNLRQSFQSKLEKDEAAFFSLVFPKDSISSQNFSGAIGYNVFDPDKKDASLRPFVEWQKNTASDKKVNVRFAGLAFQGPLWNFPKNQKKTVWTPYGIAAVNFKEDRIKQTKGLQSSFYFTPIFKKINNIAYPLPDVIINTTAISFYYNVYSGFEFEDRKNSIKKTAAGSVKRFYNRAVGYFYPLPNLLQRRLEIIPDFTYRTAINNKTTYEKSNEQLFKLSINIILITKESSKLADVKIGYDYINGIDPTKGFDDQSLQTITLKIKI